MIVGAVAGAAMLVFARRRTLLEQIVNPARRRGYGLATPSTRASLPAASSLLACATMLGFEHDEVQELGSRGRYRARLDRFARDGAPLPRLRHQVWWLVHNCLAHLAIGIAPTRATFTFHDWTSRKLNRLAA